MIGYLLDPSSCSKVERQKEVKQGINRYFLLELIR